MLYSLSCIRSVGPVHWELLARARALDTQCYVGMCSPACDLEADYVSHAESMITSPWSVVVAKAGKGVSKCVTFQVIDISQVRILTSALCMQSISHRYWYVFCNFYVAEFNGIVVFYQTAPVSISIKVYSLEVVL